MSENRAHVPVLFGPVLEYLRPYSNGKYIDGTVGLGGHTAGIAEACAPGGRVLGLDADPLALEYAAENLKRFGDRILLRHSNFLHLRQVAEENEFLPADGVLLDLGLSSLQLADPQRGFSFQSEGHLDMRFDPTQGDDAADLINTLDERSLADLIFQFGEEHASRRIARAVVAARPINSAAELGRVIERAVGRHGRLHPATRTFQALRIQVNRELAVLQAVLPQVVQVLGPAGRVVIITFHSLEDRIVKHFMRDSESLRVLTKHPIKPERDEVVKNPRSRSAKLRAAERVV